MKFQTAVILHNIRSVYNVGAIFRTCDAAGVSKIYLTGYTPAPIDRFNKLRKDFAKASLGSENTVSWEYIKNPLTVIKKLKKDKYKIVALEQDKNSVDYKKLKLKGNTAIILGNEVLGISNSLLKQSDVIVEIPMKGKKESLNVSVSFGIALFRLLNI